MERERALGARSQLQAQKLRIKTVAERAQLHEARQRALDLVAETAGRAESEERRNTLERVRGAITNGENAAAGLADAFALLLAGASGAPLPRVPEDGSSPQPTQTMASIPTAVGDVGHTGPQSVASTRSIPAAAPSHHSMVDEEPTPSDERRFVVRFGVTSPSRGVQRPRSAAASGPSRASKGRCSDASPCGAERRTLKARLHALCDAVRETAVEYGDPVSSIRLLSAVEAALAPWRPPEPRLQAGKAAGRRSSPVSR